MFGQGGKWRYGSIVEMPGTFTLMDRKGQHWALVPLEASDGIKSFWVYIVVDGDETEQEKYLRKKPRKLVRKFDQVSAR